MTICGKSEKALRSALAELDLVHPVKSRGKLPM